MLLYLASNTIIVFSLSTCCASTFNFSGVTWMGSGTHQFAPIDTSKADRRSGPRAADGTSLLPAPVHVSLGPGGKQRAMKPAGGDDRAKFTGFLTGSARGHMLPSMVFIKCSVDADDLQRTTVCIFEMLQKAFKVCELILLLMFSMARGYIFFVILSGCSIALESCWWANFSKPRLGVENVDRCSAEDCG